MNKKVVFVIMFLLVVCGLAALVPTLLSSDWTRQALLERVNKRGKGKLALQECSIGWRSGLVCRQVDYTDAGLHLHIPEITVNQGVLAYLVSPHHLGIVTLDHPQITLTVASPTNTTKTEQQAVEAQSKSSLINNHSNSAGKAAPLWDKLVGHLRVQDASIFAAFPDKKRVQLISHVTAESRLASGSVEFELDGKAADDSGSVQVKGFINLPIRETGMLETLISETHFQLTDLEISPYGALLSGHVDMPDFVGRISGSGLVKTTGLDTLTLTGSLLLDGFQASGGFLGNDQPELDAVELSLELTKDMRHGVRIPSLNLTSDLATIDITGAYNNKKSTLQGKAVVDLPALFTQLPETSRLDPMTRLDTGSLDVSFDIMQENSQVTLAADAQVAGFSGMHGKHPFTWDTPIKFTLAGSKDPVAGMSVQKVMLTAPFMHCSGQGNLESFSLQGGADLALASRELGKIFTLDWQGSGTLAVKGESKKTADNRYLVSTDITLPDLMLEYQGETVLPGKPFSLTARLETPGTMPATKAGAMQLHVILSAWPGEINTELTAMYKNNNKLSSEYSSTATLKLGRITEIGHTLRMLSSKTTLTGTMNIEAKGSVHASQIIASSFAGKVNKLVLHSDGVFFRDNLVTISAPVQVLKPETSQDSSSDESTVSKKMFAPDSGSVFLDLEKRQLAMHAAKLVSSKAEVELREMFVDDWKELPASLVAQASATADLTALTPVLQQLKIMPTELALGGKGMFTLDLAGAGGDINVSIKQPVISKKGEKVFRDGSLTGECRFKGNLFRKDLQVNPVKFAVSALKIKAAGKVQRTGEKPHFQLQGTFKPNVEQLAGAFSPDKEIGFSVQGEQEENFVLQAPLGKNKNKGLKNLFLKTAFHAKKMSSAGFVMDNLSMPLHLEKGVGRAQMTASIYSSPLTLNPQIDFTVTPPLLTLPEKSRLLTDAELDRPLVDGLLKRIHPLLGQLARPRGTISAEFEQFFLPLTGNGIEQADFHLVFDTSKLMLSADGILREILAVAGYDDDIIALKQSRIDCYGKQGNVQCTPLHILAADSEMVLSGSIGLDGSLDYLLEIPITKGLVGKEGFRILEGATLQVPIKGNNDKAVFDAELLKASMKSLLTQAATKKIKKQIKKIIPDLLDKFLGN